MILTTASIKNLQRKGPAPKSFALGVFDPWGSIELRFDKDDEHAAQTDRAAAE